MVLVYGGELHQYVKQTKVRVTRQHMYLARIVYF